MTQIHLMKKFIVALVGIISAMYLFNFGLGFIELIPDNFPIVGNLDEAAATALLLSSLSYFGIDLFNIFKKDKKEVTSHDNHEITR